MRNSAASSLEVLPRATLLAAGSLASRLLGAVRDAVIAARFPTAATDAFFVAFTIPNALRALVGEGALSAGFVPVLTEVETKHGEARARRVQAVLSGRFLLLLALLTVAGIALAPFVVRGYAGGYDRHGSRFALTVQLTQQVFPYIFFMGAAALAAAVLQTSGRFRATAWAPLGLNLSMIAAPWLFAAPIRALGLADVTVLAWGALLGGALHLGTLIWALKLRHLWVRPSWRGSDPYVRKTLLLLLPLLGGIGVYEINLLLSRLYASFLAPGAQSYLYYSQRLIEIPQGLVATAVATAMLPTLSRLHQGGDRIQSTLALRQAVRWTLTLTLPAALLLALAAEPLVDLLFRRGRFGAYEVQQTARALRWQSLGIVAVSVVRNLVPAFHARNDTRTPVVCGAINLAAFASLAPWWMRSMQHAGIAAATSAASFAQLAALLYFHRRHARSCR